MKEKNPAGLSRRDFFWETYISKIVFAKADISNRNVFDGIFQAESLSRVGASAGILTGHWQIQSFANCNCRMYLTNGAISLGRLIKNNYTNVAQLKELTTIPPMTAERHAAIMRKRIAHRRMVEEAKELKLRSDPLFDAP